MLVTNHEITGAFKEFGGATAPTGYLLCDGSVVSRSAYPALYNAITTTWNTGGETGLQFRLPDLRGKTLIGSGQDTGRSLTARSVGQYTGVETVALLASHLPPHNHSAGSMAGETQTHAHSASTSGTDINHTHSYQQNDPCGCVDGPSNDTRWNNYFGNNTAGPNQSLHHGHPASMNANSGDHSHTFTTNSGDLITNTVHANIQPFFVAGIYIKY